MIEDPDAAPRQEIRAAIRRLVTGAGGSMIRRPLLADRPDGPGTEEPEPLAGIRAAASLQFQADQALRRSVKTAREEGLDWAAVGEVLFPGEPDPEEERSKAVRAFDRFASTYEAWHEPPTFTWTCRTCTKFISDYGPEAGGHPADVQRGHAVGCAQLAEAVAAYDAMWEEEEE